MTHDEDEAAELVVRRVIAAPRERVFAAWLDPVSLARWMRPGKTAAVTAVVDARVGGRFRIVMEHGGGDVDHWGEYLVIDRPSRLSFTWISANTDHYPSLVTVDFLDRGSSTEVILSHRRLPTARLDMHRQGWTGILDRLHDTFAGTS
jgi:uncharacterized protein YndB with AHSA1/START domain